MRIKANLSKNKEIANIYMKCKNNDSILEELDKLIDSMQNQENEELYRYFLIFRDDFKNYIEKEKEDKKRVELDKTLANNNAIIFINQETIKKLTKEKDELCELRKEFRDLKQENNNLNIKMKNLQNKNINMENEIKVLKGEKENMKNRINQLETGMSELKKKVDFMEPIVLAIICRKALNYFFIKILNKYKKKIKVTLLNNDNNDFKYDIEFIESVNDITVEELNNLIKKLFNKKDVYNKESHLINKEVPNFINDLWGIVKENLNLNERESIIFNAIITE